MTDPALAVARRTIGRQAFAVGVASGVYGVSFGALSVQAGLSVAQTMALSVLMFTGASQFALVGIVSAGGSAFAGALAAVLLGVRNGLYGLRLAPLLGFSGPGRGAAAQWVIDESTAMAVSRPTPEQARIGFLATGAWVFVLWNASTLLGAVAGTTIGDPRALGLDAAAGGAFLALLWPRLVDLRTRLIALIAAAIALGLVPFTPASLPVLSAALVALVAGARR